MSSMLAIATPKVWASASSTYPAPITAVSTRISGHAQRPPATGGWIVEKPLGFRSRRAALTATARERRRNSDSRRTPPHLWMSSLIAQTGFLPPDNPDSWQDEFNFPDIDYEAGP